MVLNANGQLAFYGGLAGPGVEFDNRIGIWAEDRSGYLRLIARTGDMLEVVQGDFREISYVSFYGSTGNGDSRPSGFNDSGQLAFRAEFTDGTEGIFVSELASIPEPTSCTLALILLCLAVGRRC